MTKTEKFLHIDYVESLGYQDIADIITENYGECYYVGHHNDTVRFFYDDGKESISHEQALDMVEQIFDNLNNPEQPQAEYDSEYNNDYDLNENN